jgi:DNA-binding beta-propeller fold protein YncE
MWIASRGNNTVYKIKDGALVKAFTGDKYFPVALAVDSKDRVYFASTQDRGIFMIDGETVTKVVGTGEKATKDNFELSLSGPASEANIGNIGGMYIGKDGCLYYTDYLTFTIMKVTPDADGNFANGKISIVAGLPFSAAIVNGTTDKAQFKYPSGIVVSDDCKKIYVSEPTGYVLRMIDLS